MTETINNIFQKATQMSLIKWITNSWKKFKENHPGSAQFIMFLILSNGITVLQMALMPIFRNIFILTELVDINVQLFPIAKNFDGSTYYIFNYAEGAISNGGGGGLAYFLAVQITLAIAQIINFFAQRNITFKSKKNPWIAALWYFIAYVAITFIAAVAQGLYKAPIYKLLINTWGLGSLGEVIADSITMVIYSAISFWVFYPIFKLIFKNTSEIEVINE
ncbi:GtrA domain-containing protein [Haloplasma contractile]|uniref:GtrA-like protein n=1 Tax=Haloplasma contractile SSD-17B TaxID=1033810 RepID=F7Q1T0_9MOLU|nr:GtrA family protein [Haloplasma contractile]ERJ12257.1 GtrA-like protein [Haloplasma contractile SSD-17B]